MAESSVIYLKLCAQVFQLYCLVFQLQAARSGVRNILKVPSLLITKTPVVFVTVTEETSSAAKYNVMRNVAIHINHLGNAVVNVNVSEVKINTG